MRTRAPSVLLWFYPWSVALLLRVESNQPAPLPQPAGGAVVPLHSCPLFLPCTLLVSRGEETGDYRYCLIYLTLEHCVFAATSFCIVAKFMWPWYVNDGLKQARLTRSQVSGDTGSLVMPSCGVTPELSDVRTFCLHKEAKAYDYNSQLPFVDNSHL